MEYSRDIHMYRLCVGYVSVMYRLCIGTDSELEGSECVAKKDLFRFLISPKGSNELY